MEGEQTADLIRAQLRKQRALMGMNQEEFGRRANYSASRCPLWRPEPARSIWRMPSGPTKCWIPKVCSCPCSGWRDEQASPHGSDHGWRLSAPPFSSGTSIPP